MDFVTSDWHFGHHGICGPEGFCHTRAHFKDADSMDTYLINIINRTVGPEDTIYHLGDLSMNMKREKLLETLSKLNGQLRLVRGNHDDSTQMNYLKRNNYTMTDGRDKFVFYEVGTRIKSHRKTYYLTHYPMVIDPRNKSFRSICGDIHEEAAEGSHTLNIGIDSPELPEGHPFGAPVQLEVAFGLVEQKIDSSLSTT